MVWLKTDEYQEVATTLEACRHFVRSAKDDATYWKWVFIAVHSIVQGCMVIALTGSDGFGARSPTNEKAWRKAHSTGADWPKGKDHLLSFLELYAKIQKPGMIQFSAIGHFTATKTHTHAIEKLNEVRNEFIHFSPKGWSLELSGAPTLVLHCLEVAEFLVTNSGRFSIFLSYKEGELLGLITELKRELGTA